MMASESPVIIVRTRFEGKPDEWSSWVESDAKLALYYDGGSIAVPGDAISSADELKELCAQRDIEPKQIDICAVNGRDKHSWPRMREALHIFSDGSRGVALVMHKRTAVDDEIKALFAKRLETEDIAERFKISTYSCGDADEERGKFKTIANYTHQACQRGINYGQALRELRFLLCEWWKVHYFPKSVRDRVVDKMGDMKHRFGNEILPLLGDFDNIVKSATDSTRCGVRARNVMIEVLDEVEAARSVWANGFEAWVNRWRPEMTGLVRNLLEFMEMAFRENAAEATRSKSADFSQKAQDIRQGSLLAFEQLLDQTGVAVAKRLDILRAGVRRQTADQLAGEQIETMRSFCEWCRKVNREQEALRSELHELAEFLKT